MLDKEEFKRSFHFISVLDLYKNTDLMWKQSVWTSTISSRLAALHLKEGGLLTLAGAKAALSGTGGKAHVLFTVLIVMTRLAVCHVGVAGRRWYNGDLIAQMSLLYNLPIQIMEVIENAAGLGRGNWHTDQRRVGSHTVPDSVRRGVDKMDLTNKTREKME